MEQLSVGELGACADAWDAAVARDPAVDPFCSRSAWQLSFHEAFAPARSLWLAREGDDQVVLARSEDERGAVFEPLENMWQLGSPLIGAGAAALLARSLPECVRALALTGLPMDRGRLAPLLKAVRGRYEIRVFTPTTRFAASLEGGMEGWLGRRSRPFRRSLRAAERRVAGEGVSLVFVDVAGCQQIDALYARVLEVERRSWKGRQGIGAEKGAMSRFYRAIWPRLVERGELRLLFAERDGETLGYLHGGLVGDHFRGLQLSFGEEVRRLGLGNVLQLRMLERLYREGARSYDLGGRSAYKGHWAERGLTTFGLLLIRR